MSALAPYAKSFYLFLAAIVAATVPLVTQGHPTQAELINVILVGLAAFVTYFAAELPSASLPYIKTLIAAVMAGGAVLITFVNAGGSLANIPPAEVIQIVSAAVAVLLGPAHQVWFGTPQKAAA